VHELSQSMGRSLEVTKGGLLHVGSSAITAGKVIASFVQAVAVVIGHVFMALISGIAHTIVFIVQIPINVYEAVSNTKVVNAVITPADHMHADDVPIIDPNDPALAAAKKALPAVSSTSQAPQEAQWPIHGAITTYFGEKGPHYHPTHTGIDISDGQRSGVTPVRPFRSGKVIVAERSGGLGNHVIIDHGSGITSVYGHMYSIAVKVGQDVDTTTELGREGTTGVSTGPHVHFEIRVNGQATDPRGFIAGTP
jgi:murein DD-endopeptidase MepM/ murein hydrolase activator NlpD